MRSGNDPTNPSTPIQAWPNGIQGFGRVHLEDLLTGFPAQVFVDEAAARALNPMTEWSHTFRVHDPTQPTKVVLTWSDVPALQDEPSSSLATSSTPLVNNLDLSIEFGNPCESRHLGNRTTTDGSLMTPDREVSVSYGCVDGVFDNSNNVEVVRFATTQPEFVVRIRSAEGATAQQFALVLLNAYDAQDPPPMAPEDVLATSGELGIHVSWRPSAGASEYEVQRRTVASPEYMSIATTSSTTFTDLAVASDAAYQYRIRSRSGVRVSPFSAGDVAVTVSFTDTPLITSTTVVKAAHVTELRAAIDLLRALGGLGPATYAETILAGGSIPVRSTHLQELRSALSEAAQILGVSLPSFTDSSPLAGIVPVKAVHFNELRTALQ